ncbi:hypothetical protein AB4Z52_27775 [Rhizobium sp. 2YAF20]|uniref:hypothetical protein n=1 Tax=Rhizobium sp. 2YAF20 TaxID=3233027 RepID=UPI003F980998
MDTDREDHEKTFTISFGGCGSFFYPEAPDGLRIAAKPKGKALSPATAGGQSIGVAAEFYQKVKSLFRSCARAPR